MSTCSRLRDVRQRPRDRAQRLEVDSLPRRQHLHRQPEPWPEGLCPRPVSYRKVSAKGCARSITARLARECSPCVRQWHPFLPRLNPRDISIATTSGAFSASPFHLASSPQAKEGNQRLGRTQSYRHLGGRGHGPFATTNPPFPKLSRCVDHLYLGFDIFIVKTKAARLRSFPIRQV